MKISTQRRLKDEDLHAKKTHRQRPPHLDDLEMKTSTPRRLGDEDLLAKKIRR
jgi:hypothetical protein